jgi:hypothetical protein
VPPARRAAIDVDKVLQKPLKDISAVELIHALSRDDLASARSLVSDKKKYELWTDETVVIEIPLADLLDRIKGEKKKLELEVPPWFRFEDPLAGPGMVSDQLVSRIADAVEARLSSRGGGR